MARAGSGAARGAAVALALLAIVMTTGGLGAPFSPDEVPFSSLRRDHFDALAVQHEHVEPNDAPLVLRVQLLGDAAPDALSQATRWLARHVNVVVVFDERGAPLYLTADDLAATSGRATLGATLRSGMAAEVRDPDVAPCVLVHEMLHFLGLRHVEDDGNIMSPQCRPGKLDKATIEPWQVSHVASLETIRAVTPRGLETWAHR